MEFFNVPNHRGSSLNGRELIDFTNIFLISKIQLSYTPTVKKQFLININQSRRWLDRTQGNSGADAVAHGFHVDQAMVAFETFS
jgi:hypothetical protein